MKKVLLATAMLAALASGANALTVNLGLDPTPWNTDNVAPLTLSPVQPGGNQPTNLPCIICGANQPQQPAGMGYNLYSNQGNDTTLSYFSTNVSPGGGGSGLALDQFIGATGYGIGLDSPFLNALGGNLSFSIGIDVNQTGATAQTLESFWFLNLSTHTVLAAWSPEPGGQLIGATANGTGFPDWTISGLTLAGISPGDSIMFFARMTGLNDGPDSFFIVPVPGPNVGVVPLPGAAWLFLTGLGGLWALNRKRRNRTGDPAQMQAA